MNHRQDSGGSGERTNRGAAPTLTQRAAAELKGRLAKLYADKFETRLQRPNAEPVPEHEAIPTVGVPPLDTTETVEQNQPVEALIEQRRLQIGDAFLGLKSISEEELPFDALDSRSANRLKLARCETWGDLASRTIGDLWMIPNAGRLTVSRILEAASARNQVALTQQAHHGQRLDIDAARQAQIAVPVATSLRNEESSDLHYGPTFVRREQLVREIAIWAVLERNAEYLHDLMAPSTDLGHMPSDIEALFRELGGLSLRQAFQIEVGNVASDLSTRFVEQLGERAQIFIARQICLGQRPTLAELAEPLGLTRERVRQVEQASSERAARLRQAAQFAPLSWRADDLRDALGLAVPADAPLAQSALDRACRGLSDPPCCTIQELMLWLAGPYRRSDGQLVRADSSVSDVAEQFEQRVGECWLIAADEAIGILGELGIAAAGLSTIANLLPAWRNIGNGWLVRWSGTLGNKAAVIFSLTCVPMTVEKVNVAIGEGNANSSLRNALTADERFVRLDKINYGLRAWGLEEYSGIAQEIAERIERAGGVAALDDIVIDLVEKFEVAESSVRQYATTPAFVLEGGQVRLRTSEDPFAPDTRIVRVSGLYISSDGKVTIHLPVDKDALRGSGRPFPEPAAVVLGLGPGQSGIYEYSDLADSVTVTWNPTSVMGPSLGSVRSIAIHLGCKLGDRLRLTFNASPPTCTAEIPDSSTLAGLTGLHIRAGHEIETLAAAIGCEPAAVRAELQARGEQDVLRLLPQIKGSPGLENALSQFGDLIS